MAFDPFTSGFDLAKTILDKFFPDANEEMKQKFIQASAEIQNEFNLQLGQLDINKTEAASSSLLVAGGRPAAIWIGVAALAYNGLFQALFTWIAACFGLPPLPIADDTAINAVTMTLLGVSGMRSVDKYNKVETNKIK